MDSPSLLLLLLLLLPPNWFGFTGRTGWGLSVQWMGQYVWTILGSPTSAACCSDVREANQQLGDACVAAHCAETLYALVW